MLQTPQNVITEEGCGLFLQMGGYPPPTSYASEDNTDFLSVVRGTGKSFLIHASLIHQLWPSSDLLCAIAVST